MFSFKTKLLLLVGQIATIIALLSINNSLTFLASFKSVHIKTSPKITFADLLVREPQVLAAAVIATPTPVPTPASRRLSKKTYTIAAIGDSMVQTMGGSLDYLQPLLKNKYPNTNFIYYNFGLGGENVEQGLAKFDQEFPGVHPDILIVGSFSYNPFPVHDHNKHWSLLSDLIRKGISSSGHTYVLAEIAPLETGFGKGIGGVNWPEDIAHTHSLHIIEQLDNAVGLAGTMGVDLVNVYSASQIPGSKFGRPEYVAKHDGIHPSATGQRFTAEKIVSKIELH